MAGVNEARGDEALRGRGGDRVMLQGRNMEGSGVVRQEVWKRGMGVEEGEG